ncbi:enoyl-CoA hydratase/isomerase family protein [Nitratireductor thuwali]|uniref:3-hydroxyisobutyryl-CoA hydrolase n=1 Tax=Nitratireductor thuwali TaxID=2267699 RepID=A0ABY5MQL3_9HYPH|nr:putative enoyl-CoA hydratase echA8 [Nitratireductor thuwali]
MERDFGAGDDIRFTRMGKAGIITLTRAQALNAVNHRMIRAIAKALEEWRDDDAVELVIIKGEGRAFSAGGDLQEIYHSGRAGKPDTGFFADEYRLNAAIANYPKPYVALIDGIVMGGGVGLSCHGSHRVMTEKTVFAMPEVGIGFFPDVGGSHILSRLVDSYGQYLALTGNRIGQGDAIWCGLGTHAVASQDLEALTDELSETGKVEAALSRRCRKVPRDIDDATIHVLSEHFSLGTLKDVVASLKEAADKGDEFAGTTLATMETRSPTSLHVTFREIDLGAMLSIEESMRMEFRILNRMLESHDFYEGIRAAIIEKTKDPKWQPARLEDVTKEMVDAYFDPLGEGELEL